AEILRREGVQVEEDFLREECDALNPVFFHYITTGLPYVLMKYAMTLDGKIATKTGASKWISGEESRMEVQKMRHACMGIMVGIGTVLADDPRLNCRLEGGRDPVRIICDSRLRIPVDAQAVRTAGEQETIVVFADRSLPEGAVSSVTRNPKAEALLDAGVTLLNLPGERGVDLLALCRMLGEREIDSVLLEGGGTLNESALRAGIVNELRAFVAPKIFGGAGPGPVMGEGVELPAQAVGLRLTGVERIGEDLMLSYRPGKE
ncbi:MAG: bifunctional diaminohydroxyphosphoribosylaminopyrimidine deaminase/5-amino-6-(5-phosphoribosylamino)uracil reductase RibD, partial [Oscillospiraceae bacterium]|nr:bifunctional diaminohydroxyphosphoribosylaminopyrimidine deaminase/5-amino-6-(5-phosphoribosylamino)uracil reductase RibD [Oscillospiraceae bacterium]